MSIMATMSMNPSEKCLDSAVEAQNGNLFWLSIIDGINTPSITNQPHKNSDKELHTLLLLFPCDIYGFIGKSNEAETSIANWHISCREQPSQIPNTDSALLVKLHCERKEANVIYLVNYKLTLIAKSSDDAKPMNLVKKGKVLFEPLDHWRALMRLDWSYLVDPENMFLMKIITQQSNVKLRSPESKTKISTSKNKNILKHVKNHNLSMTYSDGVLDIDGRLIFVNKQLLSKHSPVFDVMFNSSSFVESQQEAIKLEDVDCREMLELLDHIYKPTPQTLHEQWEYSYECLDKTPAVAIIQPLRSRYQLVSMLRYMKRGASADADFHQKYASYKCLGLYLCMQPTYRPSDYDLITENNIRNLLKLADFYQINDLLVKCENWLLEYENFNFLDPEQLNELLCLAEKHKFSRFMKKCMNYSDVIVRSEGTDMQSRLSLESVSKLENKLANEGIRMMEESVRDWIKTTENGLQQL